MMQNEIFKFEPDKPAIISLKYRTGKPFRRGDYSGFTYTLTNGLVTFFPEEVDREIQALHVDAGQPIKVTKKTSGGWDIERVPSGPVNSELPNRPAGSSVEPPNVCAQHITPTPALTTRESQAFYRQLVASIEAAKSAQEHAARIGYPVSFSSEDIRALAISGFIQQAREGY